MPCPQDIPDYKIARTLLETSNFKGQDVQYFINKKRESEGKTALNGGRFSLTQKELLKYDPVTDEEAKEFLKKYGYN